MTPTTDAGTSAQTTTITSSSTSGCRSFPAADADVQLEGEIELETADLTAQELEAAVRKLLSEVLGVCKDVVRIELKEVSSSGRRLADAQWTLVFALDVPQDAVGQLRGAAASTLSNKNDFEQKLWQHLGANTAGSSLNVLSVKPLTPTPSGGNQGGVPPAPGATAAGESVSTASAAVPVVVLMVAAVMAGGILYGRRKLQKDKDKVEEIDGAEEKEKHGLDVLQEKAAEDVDDDRRTAAPSSRGSGSLVANSCTTGTTTPVALPHCCNDPEVQVEQVEFLMRPPRASVAEMTAEVEVEDVEDDDDVHQLSGDYELPAPKLLAMPGEAPASAVSSSRERRSSGHNSAATSQRSWMPPSAGTGPGMPESPAAGKSSVANSASSQEESPPISSRLSSWKSRLSSSVHPQGGETSPESDVWAPSRHDSWTPRHPTCGSSQEDAGRAASEASRKLDSPPMERSSDLRLVRQTPKGSDKLEASNLRLPSREGQDPPDRGELSPGDSSDNILTLDSMPPMQRSRIALRVEDVDDADFEADIVGGPPAEASLAPGPPPELGKGLCLDWGAAPLGRKNLANAWDMPMSVQGAEMRPVPPLRSPTGKPLKPSMRWRSAYTSLVAAASILNRGTSPSHHAVPDLNAAG